MRHGERTITITDLRPQNPPLPQFIDTDFEISEIAFTGNVLLAKGSDTVVAWLLIEGGAVSGIFDNRRADRSDSLWDMSLRHTSAELLIEDGIAGVRDRDKSVVRIYNAETGEVLEPGKMPLDRMWYPFGNIYLNGPCDLGRPLKRPVSRATFREGWVKDPEGKHRLWLRASLRSAENSADWLDKVKIMRFKNSSELVIIKF